MLFFFSEDGEPIEIKEEYNNDEHYQDMCLSKFDLDYKLKRSEHQHEFFFTPNENCKSDVWDRFYLIYYRGIKQDYVKCRKCFSILSYKSRTGTASLLRHNCERKNAIKAYEQEAIVHPIIPSLVNKNISDEARNQIHEGQLYFLAKDMHAFDTTDRVGFKRLAQLLINFGSSFGNQSVNEVLAPSDYLVNSLMTTTISNISRVIRNYLLDEDLALTIDISNETCSQKRFLTLSGHVVTVDYVFKSFIINTIEIENSIDLDLKKTILTLLDDYIPNSESKLSKSVVVIDQHQLLSDSLADCKVFPSIGHIMQAILDNILSELPEQFRSCLNTIKDLVQNMETIPNRNLNVYYTLKYFHDYLQNACQEGSNQDLSKLDIPTLQVFYELLELFKECLTDLKADDTATIGKVYLWKVKLETYCKSIPAEDEDSVIYYLKTRTLALLDEHLIPNDYHKIALFLNPNFKGLKFLKIAEKQEIYDLIKSMISKIKEQEDLIFFPGAHSSSSSSKPPPPKRFKDEIIFGEMMDATEGESDDESTESEIFRYVNYKLKDHCSDILEYWKMTNDFPNLKKLVRRILNIPASVESKQNVICQGTNGSNASSSSSSSTVKTCSCAFKDNIKSLVFLNKNFGLVNCI